MTQYEVKGEALHCQALARHSAAIMRENLFWLIDYGEGDPSNIIWWQQDSARSAKSARHSLGRTLDNVA